MNARRAEPALFVIFGGTGDLARRKLLPELAQALVHADLTAATHVVGVAPRPSHDDESYTTFVRECLADAKVSEEATERFCGGAFHYHAIGDGTVDDYRSLGERLDAIEKEHGLTGNRVYYLSIPPRFFPQAITGLGEAGLAKGEGCWRRLVIEKPFGKDLQSARELNALLHEHFDEDQVYRIDHYLGKDLVQNLLVLRFANALFESAWNRERVHSVQIAVSESLGLGTRAGYYDKSGCLRDMIQNHLMQLVTLVAMEVPSAFEADAIRYEKVKVLKRITPIREEDVVFGQYTTGEIDGERVSAYLDEDGVHHDSTTETFVALKLKVDSWRWSGVPFFLVAGKRLPHRSSRIVVRFRPAPVSLFDIVGGGEPDGQLTDALVIKLQPDEGFSLHVNVKRPEEPFHLQEIPLRFDYDQEFGEIPGAYETLLLDIMQGNQTLFVHADEVEESWKVVAPILDNPPETELYRAGTWGPKSAARLSIREHDLWQSPPVELS